MCRLHHLLISLEGHWLSFGAETYRLIPTQGVGTTEMPPSVRILRRYLGAWCGQGFLLPDVTVPALPLSFRYETRRCPSRGTLFGPSSMWRTAIFTLRSSAASIMKQKCWTQQWWAQRLYKSEPLIRTKEPTLKSTTPFRQVGESHATRQF